MKNQDLVIAAKKLMDNNPNGFYVTELFRKVYPLVPMYNNPEKSNSPTAEYTAFLHQIKKNKNFTKMNKKYVLKGYKPNSVNENTKINQNSKSEPIGFIRWLWRKIY